MNFECELGRRENSSIYLGQQYVNIYISPEDHVQKTRI